MLLCNKRPIAWRQTSSRIDFACRRVTDEVGVLDCSARAGWRTISLQRLYRRIGAMSLIVLVAPLPLTTAQGVVAVYQSQHLEPPLWTPVLSDRTLDASRWNIDEDSPPLSASCALRIAANKCRDVCARFGYGEMHVETAALEYSDLDIRIATLNQAPMSDGAQFGRSWRWVVTYTRKTTSDGRDTLARLPIVVLMNGCAVSPSTAQTTPDYDEFADSTDEVRRGADLAFLSQGLSPNVMSRWSKGQIETNLPWEAHQDNPPLSPGRAISIAAEVRDKLVPAGYRFHWPVRSLRLIPFCSERRQWYWVVRFEGNVVAVPHANASSSGVVGVPIIVRMDGKNVDLTFVPDDSELEEYLSKEKWSASCAIIQLTEKLAARIGFRQSFRE